MLYFLPIFSKLISNCLHPTEVQCLPTYFLRSLLLQDWSVPFSFKIYFLTVFILDVPFEIPTFHVGSQLALPTFKIILPRWLAWCWARRATSPPGCLPPPSASSSMLPSCPCSLRSRCFLRAILNYWSWCKFSKANSLAGILLNTLGMIGGALLLLGIGLYEPELEAFFGGQHDH